MRRLHEPILLKRSELWQQQLLLFFLVSISEKISQRLIWLRVTSDYLQYSRDHSEERVLSRLMI